jgi:hypothetical protein
MVDWDRVENLRRQGAGWEEIARDGGVGLAPDRSGRSPGRQLRAEYRARRDHPADGPDGAGGAAGSPAVGSPTRWSLARIGWLLFAILAPWAFLAFVLPSPVGVFLPVIPLLGFAAAAAAALLAVGLLKTSRKWTEVYRSTATAGAVVGLVVAGALGAVALSGGCPVLSPFVAAEPGGFEKVPKASWQQGGLPVLLFYGSVACPFCSASSWAVLGALERLGNVSGVSYDRSSTADIYPGTPSVVLPDLAVSSPFVAFDARESTGDQQIQAPATGGCPAQGYVSAYDPLESIPFLVVGGTFFHVGTLVDPGALQGLTAGQVAQQLAERQGTAYQAIAPEVDLLLAYLVWLNGGAPAAVASDPAVAPILAGIH